MIAVIQLVKNAEVQVGENTISSIPGGILTLLGIQKGDTEAHLTKLIQKIVNLRIFDDENGKMNLSLLDTKKSHLIVSQFTLAGDCSKGRSPSFSNAERPENAKILYEKALNYSKELGVPTSGGEFQQFMNISLTNSGPATFILNT